MTSLENGLNTSQKNAPEKLNLFQRIADFIKGKTRVSTHSVLEQNKSVLYEETDPTGKVIAIRSTADKAHMANAHMLGLSFDEIKQQHKELLDTLPPLYQTTDPLGNPVAIKWNEDSKLIVQAYELGLSFEQVKDHYEKGTTLPKPNPKFQHKKPRISVSTKELEDFQTAFDPQGNKVIIKSLADAHYLDEAIQLGENFQSVKNHYEKGTHMPKPNPEFQTAGFWYAIPDPEGYIVPIRSNRDRVMMSEAFVNGTSFEVVKKHYDK